MDRRSLPLSDLGMLKVNISLVKRAQERALRCWFEAAWRDPSRGLPVSREPRDAGMCPTEQNPMVSNGHLGSTSMGPIALFDKSFLQSLSPDESVWFDHFFLANVCPIFYAETQSDLAKDDCKSGTPEELVRGIAAKFPDCSGSPNVYHSTMCTANLLGEEVPLRPQVILPRGWHGSVAGQSLAVLPESPEAKAFIRWSQGLWFIRDPVAKPIVSDPIHVDVLLAPIAVPIVIADGLDSGVRSEEHSPVVMGHLERTLSVETFYLAHRLVDLRQPTANQPELL
jgi:hypothetical protein